MPNPLADLLQKMVLDFHQENDVHPFGVMSDNIKNMFTEFQEKQRLELEAFKNKVLLYIDEQADKIRESGCDVCESATPTDENDCCLFCHQNKE